MKAHGGPQPGCISLVGATQSPPLLKQLQTHYRQEAIVAPPPPRTKQREEAEVTPSILPRLGEGFPS